MNLQGIDIHYAPNPKLLNPAVDGDGMLTRDRGQKDCWSNTGGLIHVILRSEKGPKVRTHAISIYSLALFAESNNVTIIPGLLLI